MIALWLGYATAIGLVATLVAALGERGLRLWRLPVRGAWALAMAATLAVPAALALAPAARATPDAAAAGEVLVGAATATAVALPDAASTLGDRLAALRGTLVLALDVAASRLAPYDRPLLALWLGASLGVGVVLARSMVLLRRRRRAWTERVVDGEPVLVAPDAGPAVIGGGRARVVLPAWALEMDASLRRLVLRHETEHLRAGDPHLLLAAVLAVALAPWNLALWWQLGRLRLAVELDCDRRVLRAHGDVERYGLLLMAVGQRAGGLPRLATPALAEDPGALERRIIAMTDRPVRRRALRAALLATLAGSVVLAACAIPGPNTVSGPANAPSASSVGPTAADTQATFFEFQVEQPAVHVSGLRIVYPAELRAAGTSGQVIAQFVVDTAGRVEPSSFKVIESSHETFTAAVRAAIPDAVFQPAETGGRKVRQLVQQPFVFRVPGDTTQLEITGVRLRPSRPPTATDTTTLRLNDTTLLRRVRPAASPPGAPPPPLRDGAGFFEFQVQRPATLRTNVAPTYPAELRTAGVGGQVIASFVVDTTGRVLEGSMRVIESDHALFTAAVAAVLARLEFEPARVDGGRPVRQLIQQPFVFSVGQ